MRLGGDGHRTVSVGCSWQRLKAVERKLKVIELVLRFAVCCLGVLSAALVGSDSQIRVFFSLERKARFTDSKALVFLVIANGMAAAYSLVQGVRCTVSMIRSSVVFSKVLAWIIFSCDQAMAYLSLAAVGAAMEAAVLGQYGQPELQWMKICSLYKKFCTQSGEGLFAALLLSFCMVTISCLSSFNLFRLYGGNNKGTS